MTEHNGGYVVGWFVKNELVEKTSAVRERNVWREVEWQRSGEGRVWSEYVRRIASPYFVGLYLLH